MFHAADSPINSARLCASRDTTAGSSPGTNSSNASKLPPAESGSAKADLHRHARTDRRLTFLLWPPGKDVNRAPPRQNATQAVQSRRVIDTDRRLPIRPHRRPIDLLEQPNSRVRVISPGAAVQLES